MPPIQFGLPTKSFKYWLLQLFPILTILREICETYIVEIINTPKKISINYLSFTIYMFIGEMCSGFIILGKYIYKRHKEKIKEIEAEEIKQKTLKITKSNKITIIKPQEQKQYAVIIMAFTVLIVIDGCTSVILETEYEKDEKDFWFQIQAVELISCSIFCRLLFKRLLYKHQYVSFVFIFIGIILLNIVPEDYVDPNIWKTIIAYLICFSFWGLEDAIHKFIMDVIFIQPETILFIVGIIGLVISIIIAGIEYGFNLQFRSGSPYLSSFDVIWITFQSSTTVLLVFAYIVLTFGCNLMILLLIKFYSPTHKIISDLMFQFLAVNYEKISSNSVNVFDWISLVIGFCLTWIGCLLYNEILIINLCGLNVNLVQNIVKRSQKEIDSLEIGILDQENDQTNSEIENEPIKE